jgi:hypothetical protein
MSPKGSRRKFTTEQKVAILRRYLVDKVPISDVCDEYKIQPSLLYCWHPVTNGCLHWHVPPACSPGREWRRLHRGAVQGIHRLRCR